jgi:apolipoprotein N-acyltransferase
MLFDMEVVGYLIGFGFLIVMTRWVFIDARSRGMSEGAAMAWAIMIFLFLIFVLPFYLVLRPARPPKQCGGCGKFGDGSIGFCAFCGAKA